jgi:hypothetical protein
MLTQESRSHAGIDAGENIKDAGEEEEKRNKYRPCEVHKAKT